MTGVHSCTAAPTTSTATAPFAPARASPPGPAAPASHARRRATERGRSEAAVALGVGNPRHLLAGSLPVPGTQSLSLMVIRSAPRSPGEERRSGDGQALHSSTGPWRRTGSARCVPGRTALQPAPLDRSRSGHSQSSHVRCPVPLQEAGRGGPEARTQELGAIPGTIPVHVPPYL